MDNCAVFEYTENVDLNNPATWMEISGHQAFLTRRNEVTIIYDSLDYRVKSLYLFDLKPLVMICSLRIVGHDPEETK